MSYGRLDARVTPQFADQRAAASARGWRCAAGGDSAISTDPESCVPPGARGRRSRALPGGSRLPGGYEEVDAEVAGDDDDGATAEQPAQRGPRRRRARPRASAPGGCSCDGRAAHPELTGREASIPVVDQSRFSRPPSCRSRSAVIALHALPERRAVAPEEWAKNPNVPIARECESAAVVSGRAMRMGPGPCSRDRVQLDQHLALELVRRGERAPPNRACPVAPTARR